MTKLTTRIEPVGAGGKHWCKHVTRVDPSKTNGYCFVGDWVRMGETIELPVGAVLVAYDAPDARPRGSYGNPRRGGFVTGMQTVRVLQAFERGVAELERVETEDKGWALQIRPTVESAIPGGSEPCYRLIVSKTALDLLEQAVKQLPAVDRAYESVVEGVLGELHTAEEVR